jgi:16S rRNA G966 N2-methylase RsmD
MDYPLKKNFLKLDDYLSLTKKYKPIYITSKNKSRLESIVKGLRKYNKLIKLDDDYLIIVTDSTSKNFALNSLTDFFSEECRIRCKIEGYKYSPYESFIKNNEEVLYKTENIYGKVNDQNINKYMERYGIESKMCSNYKLTYLLGIIEHFKPKKWLDLSAGWGDRLISAILKDVEYYVGVDPNPCLQPCYKSIIETLVPKDKQKNYREGSSPNQRFKVYEDKAESIDLNKVMIDSDLESFDFIFTSPPFFTFEIYSTSEGQSVINYNTVDLWLNNFLFKSIDNSWDKLEVNGHYALYIEDKPQYRYIDKLLQFMKEKPDCKFKGILYQAFYDSSYPKKYQYYLRNVYVWQKI